MRRSRRIPAGKFKKILPILFLVFVATATLYLGSSFLFSASPPGTIGGSTFPPHGSNDSSPGYPPNANTQKVDTHQSLAARSKQPTAPRNTRHTNTAIHHSPPAIPANAPRDTRKVNGAILQSPAALRATAPRDTGALLEHLQKAPVFGGAVTWDQEKAELLAADKVHKDFIKWDKVVLDDDGYLVSPKFREVWDAYKKMCHTLLTSGDNRRIASAKYFVHDISLGGGYGNRLRPILGTFLMGLVTNRCVLVRWRNNPASLDELFQRPGYDWNYGKWGKLLPKHRQLNLGDASDNPNHGDLYTATCTDIRKLSEHVIFTTGLSYIGNAIESNPFHSEWVEDNIGPNTFGTLFRAVFHLHPKIQASVDQFKRTHFEGKYVVGIQARAYGIKGLKCHPPKPPSSRRLLEHGYFRTNHDLEEFWNGVKEVADKNEPHDKKDRVYLLMTDTPELLNHAKCYLGENVIHFASAGISHKDFRRTKESAIGGLIDMWLGGEVDVLYKTMGSSYGCLMAGRTDMRAWTIFYPANPRLPGISFQFLYSNIAWKSFGYTADKKRNRGTDRTPLCVKKEGGHLKERDYFLRNIVSSLAYCL